jgi:cytochrome c oxidase cbb3-type subunit 3
MRVRHAISWIVTSVAFLCAGAACRREERSFQGTVPDEPRVPGKGSDGDRMHARPPPGASDPYFANAWGMNEGQRLYTQMNCVGCHAHGGGGMGPPLMDGQWIYGFDDASIFDSIMNGRPNGMPAFGARLSNDQAWQLVAYVKSLGGNASKAVAASRDDHMAVTPGPARVDPEPIIVGSKP